MTIVIVLTAVLLLLIMLVLGVLTLSVAIMATTVPVLVVTLVRVVVRLVVGGAPVLLFLRLVSAEVRKGMRTGGFPETIAGMLVGLRTVLIVVELIVGGGDFCRW